MEAQSIDKKLIATSLITAGALGIATVAPFAGLAIIAGVGAHVANEIIGGGGDINQDQFGQMLDTAIAQRQSEPELVR
ncbi:MAG: hypothetical protein FWE16_00180 [Firmicutes bacterium]|nr:hypothetical protein [Bacillota bacterium]